MLFYINDYLNDKNTIPKLSSNANISKNLPIETKSKKQTKIVNIPSESDKSTNIIYDYYQPIKIYDTSNSNDMTSKYYYKECKYVGEGENLHKYCNPTCDLMIIIDKNCDNNSIELSPTYI